MSNSELEKPAMLHSCPFWTQSTQMKWQHMIPANVTQLFTCYIFFLQYQVLSLIIVLSGTFKVINNTVNLLSGDANIFCFFKWEKSNLLRDI